MEDIVFIILIVSTVVMFGGAIYCFRTSQSSEEHSQAEPDVRVNQEPDVRENYNEDQNKDAEASESVISLMLNIFAWVELVAGIILAFVSLFNSIVAFFVFLLVSLFSFVILKALAVCVKAANKYLNS